MSAGKALSLILAMAAGGPLKSVAQDTLSIRPSAPILVQFTPLDLSAWRPYKNSAKLVQVGMNKAEVLLLAGAPDYEESYYQDGRGHILRISDWYYLRSGWNSETALLKFTGETLVRITVKPVQP
jgi:hypothetical protein